MKEALLAMRQLAQDGKWDDVYSIINTCLSGDEIRGVKENLPNGTICLKLVLPETEAIFGVGTEEGLVKIEDRLQQMVSLMNGKWEDRT